MSRVAPFPRFFAVISIVGYLATCGCRARAPTGEEARQITNAGIDASTATAPLAPLTSGAAVVRPVARPSGAMVLIADVDGRRVAIVADEEESAIQLVDLDAAAQRPLATSTVKLTGAPGQMLLAPDGTLFVAVRGAGRVVALRLRTGGTAAEVATHDTADEPFGLALTPDGSTVLVSTIAEPAVEAFRAADLASVFRMPLSRDPRSIAVTRDGARAFVTHATGSRVSVVDVTGGSPGKTREIALDARERRRDFGRTLNVTPMAPSRWELDDEMPPAQRRRCFEPPRSSATMKRTATQGFGLAMIGERLLLPETLVMTSDNESIPTGYGSVIQSTLSTHVPYVARIRTSDATLENGDLSGPEDKQCFERKARCLLPRAVADDGAMLYVACLDSNEVVIVDPAKDAEHAPACQTTFKEQLRMPVESPSAVAVDPERATLVIFSSFTRKITVDSLKIDIDPSAQVAHKPPSNIAEVTIPRREALPTQVMEGRTLFHRSGDRRIAANGRACASCHVEGRDDGLVWPTPAGKRQTPMLAGRLEGTAPYGWKGEHASLVLHIHTTIKDLDGTGLGAREIEALTAYVTSMRPPAKKASSSLAVARGQSLFRSSETGCSSCHVEETHFTDLETHVLSFGNGQTSARTVGFDTPSLAFVGQTAPYFHDGRYATLEDLVEHCEDPPTAMGRTKHLDPDDRRALVAYLRSL